MAPPALATCLAVLLAGCGFDGAQSLPLPGAAGGGGFEVTMTFTNATNLVPAETCRTNDTVIGSVVSVELDEQLNAEVVCRIDPEADVPSNVEATLRETSLLGERYVALDLPAKTEPTGKLGDGATIPVSRTAVDPNTEIVLGALSQVLNGGSLGSIATISEELNIALDGRSGDARSAARRLNEFVSSLDANRDGVVAALESLGRLSKTLADQRQVIAETLADLPGGLAVLDRQRPALTRALRNLSDFSDTLVPLIQASRRATIADLEHLRPILEQLDETDEELAPSLERLASFPFNGNTLFTIKGDYSGAYVQANFDLDTVITALADLPDQGSGEPEPAPPTPALPPVPAAPAPPPLRDDALGEAFDELSRQFARQAAGQVDGVVDTRRPTTLADLLAGPARGGSK